MRTGHFSINSGPSSSQNHTGLVLKQYFCYINYWCVSEEGKLEQAGLDLLRCLHTDVLVSSSGLEAQF